MNELQHRKERLASLEKRFKSIIESDSDDLEIKAKQFLKISAIVGASLFVAYKTYKALSKDDKKKKKKNNSAQPSSGPIATGIAHSAKQRIAAALFTLLYDEISERLSRGKQEVEDSLSTGDKEIN